MRHEGNRGGNREKPTLGWLFSRFAAIYGLIWLAVLIGFAGVSYPLLREFAESQLERRLRTNAALVEEYISAIGAFSKAYRPVLEQVCARLSRPALLDAQVTLFSPKSEVIADSRPGNALAVRPPDRPEIKAALRKEIGIATRYSRLDRKRMAFVAYPHVHLGKVESVIRIGVPRESMDNALWRAYLGIGAAGIGLSLLAAAVSSLFIFYRMGEEAVLPGSREAMDWRGLGPAKGHRGTASPT